MRAPSLVGLVLAGGLSQRMGRDKGGLRYRGRSLVERAMEALRPFSGSVHVSVRPAQAGQEPYTGLPLVLDAEGIAGPGAGLLSAWTTFPEAALLVLAVDLPRVDAATLGELVARRAPGKAATAFRHPDGTPEPLCAIWEPRMAAPLRRAAGGQGGLQPGGATPQAPSLRRILEGADVAWLDPPDPSRLASLNTPEALAAAELQESTSTP